MLFTNLFLTQQYKNILTENLHHGFGKKNSQKNYDVITPSFDTRFKISGPFFVQIEIPCYGLRKIMRRYPSGEKKTHLPLSFPESFFHVFQRNAQQRTGTSSSLAF